MGFKMLKISQRKGWVERFDDNVDNAFDRGRDEERYEDERRDDY